MARDWIAMRCDLATDPAVIAMAAALEIDEHGIVGRLHRLWSWADQHLATGRADGVTGEWIDRFLVTEKFSENLEKVGWLRVTATAIVFPRWTRFNGKSGKKRALTAKRVAKHRKQKRNTDSVTRALATEHDSTERSTDVHPASAFTSSDVPTPTPLAGQINAITGRHGLPTRNQRVELHGLEQRYGADLILKLVTEAKERIQAARATWLYTMSLLNSQLPEAARPKSTAARPDDPVWGRKL